MATFVHVMSEEGSIANPAADLARHIKTLAGQDPSSVDSISDQQVKNVLNEGWRREEDERGESCSEVR